MVTFDRIDLEFILRQILQAEAAQPPVNSHLAFGLREVAGTNNNVVPGQGTFGSADQAFPTATTQYFQTVTVNVDGTIFDLHPDVAGDTMTTSYASTSPSGLVVDTAPRTISNLISDISFSNPAAVQAAQAFGAQLGDGYTVLSTNPNGLALTLGVDGIAGTADDFWGADGLQGTDDDVDANNLFIGNITPDNGLSAPFNSWMTFFGQFFDHGLDLINKGGAGTVFIPLLPDDPLYDPTPGAPNFMVLTRATVTLLPGADGVLGTADDIHQHVNQTTPFVDQNQTYTSHPSHQVFLREYMTGSDGQLHSSGKLLQHAQGPDGIAGTNDDNTGMATWADVKANALKLGIILTDYNVGDVPLLATDAYGNLILGPNGFAQVVVRHDNGTVSLVEGSAAGLDLTNPDPSDPTATVMRIGHAFINDMAHSASPVDDFGNPLLPDADSDAGIAPEAGSYDNELLDAHYIAGDGRANENIALTAVHTIFHDEHNRLVEQVKEFVRGELANGDTSFALNWVLPGADLSDGIQDNEWNGERLFQTAKFGTETQYQHLVFEEFARKVAPTIHLFGNADIHLDPAIVSEFANAVYRFGHSMLDENVPLFELNPDGTPVIGPDGQPVVTEAGLIEAFTNPLLFAQHTPAEIIQGTTHQIGSEIDEFVTGALRNNLLGLPLDLAALNIARGRDTGVAPLNLVRNEIFSQTQDTNLKPYESWDEFRQFLKHDASIINFLAAYGTHVSIVGATTLADKRAAALALVTMGVDPASQTGDAAHQDAYNFMHSLGAYANNVNDPLAVHAQWSTGSITGLDNVDLWIGGLAEKQNLFGGLLGSTFNFIFETQLESLQDGDRLYYLPRIEGLHFATEIEANSFAEMIMHNTGAKHLPAVIFMTPEYTVEAGDYFEKNADGTFILDAQGHRIATDPATWLHNPVSGAQLVEVLDDGTVHFIGDDNFLGNTIVLGGTEGDDRLLAGQADDDTVWGDGGNDWIDGNNGADNLFGGDGDDIISDTAGDDIIHGDAGNDLISAGIGDDIVFGGDGNDLIDGGMGIDEIQGGTGNDIIFGGEDDDELLGNEGDDWIEGGSGGDILIGDIGAPTGQVPLYAANDVLDGGEQGDKMVGFSGDDIMLGKGGFDKFTGLLGFDWASFENEEHGVSVDMTRREFIPAQTATAGDAIRDFFIETEAVSGSAFDDVLGGTDNARVDTFNELVNVNLISGLDRYFPNAIKVDPGTGEITGTPVAFSDGNIMLGGGGSDFIQGRGGNDIIDGDARLHVALTRDASGHIFPGSQIIREILTDQAVGPTIGPTTDQFGNDTFGVVAVGDIDTAVYRDIAANYNIAIATNPDGSPVFGTDGNVALIVQHLPPGGGGGGGVAAIDDGTDTLFNIERLQFADVTIENPFATFIADFVAQGTVTIDDPAGTPLPAATSPVVGDVLSVATHLADDGVTVLSFINDVEGVLVDGVLDAATAGFFRTDIPLDELSFQWQYLDPVAVGGAPPTWVNIVGATDATFTPTDFWLGNPLRVQASFIDGLGVKETVSSAPTGILVANPAINHAPTVETQVAAPGLLDTSARENQPIKLFLPLITTFTDDTTAANQLIYTATLASGAPLSDAGLTFSVLTDAAGLVTDGLITGTPPADFTGTIDIRVKATDAGGLSVTDVFTINVLPDNNHPPVITSDGGGATAALSIAENSTAVTTVTAGDPNPGDLLTFSIVGGSDAGKFVINPTTGALAFVTAPNFEAATDFGNNNVYEVIVQVSDGALIDTQAIAVTVSNVNEAPVITSNGAGNAAAVSVAENSTAVTTVTATDPDAGATVTFSLAGGADAGKFSIDATTGALSFVTAPDFEAPTDADANNIYDVIVQASDGSLVDTQTLAVSISNVAGLTLTGTAAANTLTGAGEEDIISGLGGADTISGAGGNDTITGGTGNDIINAGAGNDLILFTIGDGADTIVGDLGLDTLNISGTAAADTLAVIFDGTALTGIAGGTLSTVEAVNADLLGGSDTLSYGTTTAGVSVNLASNGASGFASITGIENVTGGAGADTLIGNGLDNALNGGAGDDTLSGGLGVDTLTGGAGVDTVSYVGETDAMFISLATGTAQRGSAAAPVDDVLVTLENVIGGQGSDSITGSTGNNLLDGGAGFGNDSIDGGGGNDTVIGGGGDDQLLGGAGADSIDGGIGNDTIVGGAGNDTLLGGEGNDSFSYTFGDGVDSYDGGIGTDTLGIIGTTANNALGVVFDGTSITSFTGGTISGIETLTVDLSAGTDTLSYAGTTADVTVDLTGHTASGIISLLGVENVTGGSGNDTLTGDGAANILAGGAGNDTYFVGAGDTVTEGAGAGTDTVNSTATFTLGANVENLTLTGTADINGTGNGLANVMIGNSGANVLNGAAGNDTIEGGAGNDTMTGGTGNDMFVFHSGFGNDVITDFDANPTGGQDLLDLSAYAPDINAGNFGDHVSIVVSAGNTVITIDGTQHITLTGVTGVGANIITTQDFLL